jgi:hypothetical protein
LYHRRLGFGLIFLIWPCLIESFLFVLPFIVSTSVNLSIFLPQMKCWHSNVHMFTMGSVNHWCVQIFFAWSLDHWLHP